MAPKGQASTVPAKDVNFRRAHVESLEEEIVISGMSGRFPKSRNVAEYEHNLYNKMDMLTPMEPGWKNFSAEIPDQSGKIADVNKFDATFFGVFTKLANEMDPMARMLLEVAYEAVLDAGINPKSLRDSRTGVYVGACYSDSEKLLIYDSDSSTGYGILGCSRAMLANRISYTLGLNGPSLAIDTACSSSLSAIDCAFSAIRSGEIDAAIVGGSNLLINPNTTLQFTRMGVLAADGVCQPFDEAAHGYVRAEAVNCLFLQRRRECKRIYATVIYSKTNNDGFKPEGISFPSRKTIAKLFQDFYAEACLSPTILGYLETHSTGTVVGDPEECAAIDAVLCRDRSEPLLVGSVKSNMGHSEPASGISGVIKGLLALERRKIAPNINFNNPRKAITALIEGRIKVVTEIEELKSTYIGVNSFGFGGSNSHLLLRGWSKDKQNNGAPSDDLPRLVLWSGRHEQGVNLMLDTIESKPLDVEFIALLNNIQKETTPGFVFRGFGLYSHASNKNASCISREVQHFNGFQRPVVWVFSGMGSQWTSMGESLMSIPVFSAAILRCHNALKPKGLDLINIITSCDETIFNNILNSFVGIAAIQIGIVDVLRALDLKPDYMIGHSVGELGCAYADGAFTAEQMILASYSRGKVSLDMDKIKGSMAAVGLGYSDVVKILPPMIEVACHNSGESCTISGPADDIEKFIAELKAQGIFAKEVPCSNIAYHSRYIANMGPQLLKHLRQIIPHPQKRSSKWLSTSVPRHQWGQPQNELCSAEYHTNNLLNSVLFEETAVLLPQNAICIEIAPHGLLQAILRKSMPNAVNIPLTQRGNKSNVNFFLAALGKIYVNGVNVPIERLYPKVEFPVSRGTSLIAPLVQWDHSDDWFVADYGSGIGEKSGEKLYRISLKQEDRAFIAGHVIDGKVLVPATYYLQMVWETFSLMLGKSNFAEIPVEFTDVRFTRATQLNNDDTVSLVVTIHHGTGDFEVCEDDTTVVKGNIAKIFNPKPPTAVGKPPSDDIVLLHTRDFYKELRLRGYHYKDIFKGVTQARSDGLGGRIKWQDNWVAFMDTLLQVQALAKDSRSLMLPTRLEKLRIFAPHHLELLAQMDSDERSFEVQVDPYTQRLIAGGIEVIGLHATTVSRRRSPGIPVLESYQFMPHLPAPAMETKEAIRICVQTALEDNMVAKMKVVEVDQGKTAPVIQFFQEALDDLPVVSGDLMLLSSQQLDLPGIQVENAQLATQTNCMFVVSTNLLGRPEWVAAAQTSIAEGGYLVSFEALPLTYAQVNAPTGFNILAFIPVEQGSVVLMRRIRGSLTIPAVVRVSQEDTTYSWLAEVQSALSTRPVVLVAENEKLSGLIGLVNCLRKEPGGSAVACVFIDDPCAPPFALDHPLYAERLKLGLPINVLRNGEWGFYRHLKLQSERSSCQDDVHAYVGILQRGDLSSISWIQAPPSASETCIKIFYSAMNFRDIMIVTGRVNFEASRLEGNDNFGCEFSGIGKDGKRYMGLRTSNCIATHIERTRLIWQVPDSWTLAEAATVPCVYTTIYIAFFKICDIRKGKSILIHAGTGGVGQAAISVALAYGLEVFTTVSTEEKKRYLLHKFPKLQESHIGNSRDTSFEIMIAEQTKGVGVDFVLNSLAEDKLLASVRCLANKGHFLEIGKFDMYNDNKIGMSAFAREIVFHGIHLDYVVDDIAEVIEEVIDLVSDGIQDGIIKPLPTTIFKANEIEQAFRFMAAGKHMGKVIISIHEEGNKEHKLVAPISPLQRVYFDPNLVYIVVGGLGGFGLELVDWLVLRNARKVVISSSRGISKPYQLYRLELWKSYGVQVQISTDDVTTHEGCQALLNAAVKMGPIAGIFNLAVQLRDAIFVNQTPDKFRECLAPKAFATRFLDEISRKMCPSLEHFVVFSSVSCGRGNAGQTNYGMANSVMERIIEQRARDGLPAKAVQWGAVGEVGIVADMAEDQIDMEIGGTLLQRISSCLQELDNLLPSKQPIVSSMVVAEKRVVKGKNIMETVMNIMGIRDIRSVSMNTTLTEVGMDSMSTLEIKQALEREFEVFVSSQDLRTMTFQRLLEISNAKGEEAGERAISTLVEDSIRPGMTFMLRNLGDESTSEHVLLPLTTRNNHLGHLNPSLIVPGIEGVAGNVWRTLASGLNTSTNILQLMGTANMSSIQAINDCIFQNVLKLLNKSQPFFLIGYSFGTLVTLDLAHRLEQLGFQGKVALIDGSPVFLQKLITRNFGSNVSDDEFESLFFSSTLFHMLPEVSIQNISVEFAGLPDWSSRMARLLKYMESQNLYSTDYKETLVRAIFNRLKILRENATLDLPPIQSPIILIRPTDVSVPDIQEDYELPKYTHGKFAIKFIDGNHSTMLDNPDLFDILNSFDPNLNCKMGNTSL